MKPWVPQRGMIMALRRDARSWEVVEVFPAARTAFVRCGARGQLARWAEMQLDWRRG